METLRAHASLRPGDSWCKVLESEEHRLEVWEFSYSFPTLHLAAAHTVNIIRFMINTQTSSILSMRVEQFEPGIVLKLRQKADNLKRPKADRYISIRPGVALLSFTRSLPLCKVTGEVRFYQEAGLMLKKYRRFDCESINKALAEAIALLVNDDQKDFFIDMHLDDLKGKDRIGFYVRSPGLSLAKEVARRMQKREEYSEEELIRFAETLGSTLHSGHMKVTDK